MLPPSVVALMMAAQSTFMGGGGGGTHPTHSGVGGLGAVAKGGEGVEELLGELLGLPLLVLLGLLSAQAGLVWFG